MKDLSKKGTQNPSFPQVRGRGIGPMPPRRTLLPPVDPTMRFSVPSSSAQQIRFRLSGFEEMPEFSESSVQLSSKMNPVMPAAGRSLPKFRVEGLAAATASMTNYQPISPRLVGSDKKSKKSMLSRFDETISNPNLRVSQTKAARMKRHFEKDLDNRVQNPGTDIFKEEMEKMKDQFLGDISSELGFGYGHLKNPPAGSIKQGPNGSRTLDSLDKINTKINDMMNNWATDAQKAEYLQNKYPEHQNSNQVRRIPSISMKRNMSISKPPAPGKPLISSDKLATISQGFRKSLQPFSTRDTRELIKTPEDNLVSNLSEQHGKTLKKEHFDEEKRSGNRGTFNPRQPQKIGSGMITSTRIPAGNKLTGKSKTTRSLGPSRVASQDFSGVMDFRALLDAQNGEFVPSPAVTGSKKSIAHSINAGRKLVQQASSRCLISGTPMHGQLKESVKTIDHAAKMAEKLGSLMSRVAVQQNAKTSNESSTSTSEDVQKRASHLRRVADQAQRSLKLHTISCGTSPGRENEIQTQTENLNNKPTDSSAFEFTPEMSYTDQLILKKLRKIHQSNSNTSTSTTDEKQTVGGSKPK